MSKESNLFEKIVYGVLGAVFVISILINLVLLGLSKADYSLDEKSVYDWNDGWSVSYGSKNEEIITLPVTVPVGKGRSVVIKKSLPNTIKKYNCIILESYRQDVQAIVDGVPRATYSDKGTRIIGTSSPSAFVIVPIYTSDQGKEISIRISSSTSYSGYVGNISIGNEMSIVLNIIKKNILSIIVSIMLLVIAVICFVNYFSYRKAYDEGLQFGVLGVLALLVANYCLTQSKLRQLLFDDIAIIENFGLDCLMLGVLPLLKLFRWQFGERYKKIYYVLIVVALTNITVQNLLTVIAGVGLYETRSFTVAIIVAMIVLIDIFIFLDMKNKKLQWNGYILSGLAALSICVVFDCLAKAILVETLPVSMYSIGILIFAVAYYLSVAKEVSIKQQKKQDAESANIAKSQFLATMSHEIRTPINSVLGMNEMILRDTNDPTIMNYAQNIDSAGHMLLSLVNDILDFSKIESGRLELFPDEYSSKALFIDLYNLIEKRASSKGLALQMEIDSDIPASLKGDMSRVKQVLTNILTNAVKYTEKGKVTFSASMLSEAVEPTLCIKVADTGQGIKPEDIDKLFMRFTRVNEAKNKSIEGTGLGLAITKQLVEMMRGDIKVESVWGEGSTFIVYIPQEIIDATPVGRISFDINDQQPVKMKKKEFSFVYPEGKVLIVDDNKVNLVVASGLLKPSKMKIVTATSGDEAIAICKENKFDIIFMDHMMPVKDGIDTLHELKSTFGSEWTTPVVVLTANAIEGMKEMYMKEGFNDYLTKPMTAAQLETMLVKYVEIKK